MKRNNKKTKPKVHFFYQTDDNDRLICEAGYINVKGEKLAHGKYRSYFRKGEFFAGIKEECNYWFGQFNGFYMIRNSKGFILKEGRYFKGIKTGEWKYWDKFGKLQKTVLYKNGKIKEKRLYCYGRVAGDIVEEYFYNNGKQIDENSREYDNYIDPPKYQDDTKDLNDLDYYEAKELAEIGNNPELVDKILKETKKNYIE